MLDLGYTEADCILVEMDKTREKVLNADLYADFICGVDGIKAWRN